ncbi:exodeoxyribonuclease V subunit beta [Thalassotalea ponticola]|uniref:exodeoxyribonuclease V subunit beta n=1 Tax=Thalassotalea ponticola TaxID=1523392 RepID=UPI0025B40690|nr:exodeoxyribonuclease V subunit beta [Thalassotalea ponticola]MDN3653115.1 exodeoxyribonuclease V subunit beta [Thalassotalea ponticola]
MQILDAHIIDLHGSHLIEASAGTGKTFNITRLYLRLLLERQLTVEQILVMTFTKAATEEIRGRIDAFLRETLAHWQSYSQDPNNPYFYHLGQQFDQHYVDAVIKQALINLDQASIYTIHGFCARVLGEQAFASGLSFSTDMEADDNYFYLQATQDVYRRLAKEQTDDYQLLTTHWATPEQFIQAFLPVLRSEQQPSIDTVADFTEAIGAQARLANDDLCQHEALIYTHLIASKKGKQLQARQQEWEQLLAFTAKLGGLTERAKDDQQACVTALQQVISEPVDFKFIAANRLPKGEDKRDVKQQLQHAFKSSERLKKQVDGLSQALAKLEVFSLLLSLIARIQQDVSNSKRQHNVLSFDDLIARLSDALENEHEHLSKPLTDLLRRQYPVALIDEFQDTDQRQFSILQHLYLSQTKPEHYGVYLIGDPKQAIYGFRGGDIFTYLKASTQVGKRWVMDTNWRSSSAMIAGYNHLFYGNSLDATGKDVFGFGIDYQPVKPSPFADRKNLVDSSGYQALQFIEFSDTENYQYRNNVKSEYRQVVATWCALEVKRLLASAHLQGGSKQRVVAADIALLVRDSREAGEMQDALNNVGVASVYKSQRDNLFESEVALQFITVLDAIIHYQDDKRFIGALATLYFDFSAEQISALQSDEGLYERTKHGFLQLHKLWLKRGFMAMGLKLLHEYYPKHKATNERQLTNIIHLFELLQQAWQRMRQMPQLASYLTEQCHNPLSQVAELRLESDANLVQIVTLHGSKGLEYPIVFVPFATRHKDPLKFGLVNKTVLKYHHQEQGTKWHLGENEAVQRQTAKEHYSEDIRLLYVAITRAQYRCYLPLVKYENYHLSPLGHTLKMAEQEHFKDALAPLLTDDSGVGWADDRQIMRDAVSVDEQPIEDTRLPAFTGRIERDWWLSSFSALTRNMRHFGRLDAERDQGEQTDVGSAGQQDVRFSFPKGAKTGNLLHDILEHSDFNQVNWSTQVSGHLHRITNLPPTFEPQLFYQWLDEIVATPLSEQRLSLSLLSKSQTLKEAEFYFPMETVDTQSFQWLVNHFRQYYLGIAQIEFKPFLLASARDLQGMMHGFIDLIFATDVNQQQRVKYYLCDYKSSHLGDEMSHYQTAQLTKHIIAHHYDVQFLIYALALHRYLAERLDNYLFEEDFGGVYYLYLRAMSDKNTKREGVFFHPLSGQLIDALDRVFRGQPLSDECKQRLVEDGLAYRANNGESELTQTPASNDDDQQQFELF